MTTVGRSGLTAYFFPPQKTRPVRCPVGAPPKNPGAVRCPVGPPGRPGPGTGTVPGGTLPSVTMGDEEDDWKSTSGEDDGDAQGRDDEVEVVFQLPSAAGVSAKCILLLPERHEDNTGLERLQNDSSKEIRPHPSLKRLENDSSKQIRPHPSLERLENDSSKQIRPHPSLERLENDSSSVKMLVRRSLYARSLTGVL